MLGVFRPPDLGTAAGQQQPPRLDAPLRGVNLSILNACAEGCGEAEQASARQAAHAAATSLGAAVYATPTPSVTLLIAHHWTREVAGWAGGDAAKRASEAAAAAAGGGPVGGAPGAAAAAKKKKPPAPHTLAGKAAAAKAAKAERAAGPERDVLSVAWLLECAAAGRRVTPRPRHYHHLSRATRDVLRSSGACDEHGLPLVGAGEAGEAAAAGAATDPAPTDPEDVRALLLSGRGNPRDPDAPPPLMDTAALDRLTDSVLEATREERKASRRAGGGAAGLGGGADAAGGGLSATAGLLPLAVSASARLAPPSLADSLRQSMDRIRRDWGIGGPTTVAGAEANDAAAADAADAAASTAATLLPPLMLSSLSMPVLVEVTRAQLQDVTTDRMLLSVYQQPGMSEAQALALARRDARRAAVARRLRGCRLLLLRAPDLKVVKPAGAVTLAEEANEERQRALEREPVHNRAAAIATATRHRPSPPPAAPARGVAAAITAAAAIPIARPPLDFASSASRAAARVQDACEELRLRSLRTRAALCGAEVADAFGDRVTHIVLLGIGGGGGGSGGGAGGGHGHGHGSNNSNNNTNTIAAAEPPAPPLDGRRLLEALLEAAAGPLKAEPEKQPWALRRLRRGLLSGRVHVVGHRWVELATEGLDDDDDGDEVEERGNGARGNERPLGLPRARNHTPVWALSPEGWPWDRFGVPEQRMDGQASSDEDDEEEKKKQRAEQEEAAAAAAAAAAAMMQRQQQQRQRQQRQQASSPRAPGRARNAGAAAKAPRAAKGRQGGRAGAAAASTAAAEPMLFYGEDDMEPAELALALGTRRMRPGAGRANRASPTKAKLRRVGSGAAAAGGRRRKREVGASSEEEEERQEQRAPMQLDGGDFEDEERRRRGSDSTPSQPLDRSHEPTTGEGEDEEEAPTQPREDDEGGGGEGEGATATATDAPPPAAAAAGGGGPPPPPPKTSWLKMMMQRAEDDDDDF
jgi:hypothetical protein